MKKDSALMKMIVFKVIALSFAFLLFVGTIIGQDQKAFKSEADIIRALDNEWLTAYDRHDAGTIRRIFAEDARMIHSDGRVTVKADELKNVEAAAPPELKASWRAEQIEVRFYGKTAVSIGFAVQEGQYANQNFVRKYRYTSIYVRSGKRWRLVSVQYSKIDK